MWQQTATGRMSMSILRNGLGITGMFAPVISAHRNRAPLLPITLVPRRQIRFKPDCQCQKHLEMPDQPPFANANREPKVENGPVWDIPFDHL